MVSLALISVAEVTVCVLCAVVVTLEPLPAAETYVNGKQITEAVVLKQGPDTTIFLSAFIVNRLFALLLRTHTFLVL